MPRARTSWTSGIVGLKRDETDIIADHGLICSSLQQSYERYFKPEVNEKLRQYVTHSNELKLPIFHNNRVYITTDVYRVSLMMVDLHPAIIEYLKGFFEDYTPDQAQEFYFLYGNIWIFEGSNLTQWSLLQPQHLANLMAVFSKENLVDYNSSRYSWKTQPVIEARRSGSQ